LQLLLGGAKTSHKGARSLPDEFMNPQYAWQKPYVDAVREADPSKRVQRLEVARDAVRARALELTSDHSTPDEQVALEYALCCRQILRKGTM
jgi:hypothetical protein